MVFGDSPLVIRTDSSPVLNRAVFPLHTHSTFPGLSQFLHWMNWFPLPILPSQLKFYSYYPLIPRLTSNIEMSNPPQPIKPNCPPLYLHLSLSASSLLSPSLPAHTRLTNGFFSHLSSSQYFPSHFPDSLPIGFLFL